MDLDTQSEQWLVAIRQGEPLAVEHRDDGTDLIPWGHPIDWPGVPDGRQGRMRSNPDQTFLDGVGTDMEAIQLWFLAKRHKSRNTLLSYRKEITRLLLWAADQGKALSDLGPKDFIAYELFLRDPQPAERWVAAGRRFGLDDPRWRPFAGPLKPRSQRQAMTIIGSMLDWLTARAGWLRGNALTLIEAGAQPGDATVGKHDGARRNLSPRQWEAIQVVTPALPSPARHPDLGPARARFVFTLLYTLGVRISDLRGTFADFAHMRLPGDVRHRWYWRIVGKGGKEVLLPLTDELVGFMCVMREAAGALPYPDSGDEMPLVPRLRGDPRLPMTRQGLHKVIKEVMYRAADWLEMEGEAREGAAMRAVSAHWLRHTAATETLDATGDFRLTAELLRHAKIQTTFDYTHEEAVRVAQGLERRGQAWKDDGQS